MKILLLVFLFVQVQAHAQIIACDSVSINEDQPVLCHTVFSIKGKWITHLSNEGQRIDMKIVDSSGDTLRVFNYVNRHEYRVVFSDRQVVFIHPDRTIYFHKLIR